MEVVLKRIFQSRSEHLALIAVTVLRSFKSEEKAKALFWVFVLLYLRFSATELITFVLFVPLG